MTDELNVTNAAVKSPQRRSMMKAAAWAAPVVAVAAAAPMAAASINQANFAVTVGSQLTGNPTAGTGTGSLSGVLHVTNVVGSWETGPLTASYEFTGNWSTLELLKVGPPQAPFAVYDTFGIWTVTAIDEDATGTYKVIFTAPSQTVSAPVDFALPPATYAGTFAPLGTAGAPTSRNPVAAFVNFESEKGISASNGSKYPL